MSSSTISDVLTRIGAIQQQIAQLDSGSLPGPVSAPGSPAGAATGPASATGATGAGAFAGQLALAQQGSLGGGPGGTGAAGAISAALAGGAGTGAVAGYGLAPAIGTGGAGLGVALPASAGSTLTTGQQQFASTLAAETGLSPNVVTAWLLAEESGGAAQSRQAANNNDWLNIGYTGSGTYGASDAIWSDPVAAATATARWLKGQASIPGYGTASAGVQAILGSVGQTPAAQIQAIQQSGWASGGYPSLGTLYAQVTGGGAPNGSLT